MRESAGAADASRPAGAPPTRPARVLGTAGAHAAAIANSLRQADEAASRDDFSSALSWLAVIEAIGDELPASYRAKRQAWSAALYRQRS